jgi:hypothetical protein
MTGRGEVEIEGRVVCMALSKDRFRHDNDVIGLQFDVLAPITAVDDC